MHPPSRNGNKFSEDGKWLPMWRCNDDDDDDNNNNNKKVTHRYTKFSHPMVRNCQCTAGYTG